MKGVIFNLFEEVVTAAHGPDAWDALLADRGLDGVYTSLGSYDDAELMGLVDAASARLATPVDELIRWFGRAAIPLLATAHPSFFAPHAATSPFLASLNDVIHAEVRKLYPEAVVPEFEITVTPSTVTLGYRSARRLCALAEGFVLGAADHFGEAVSISQPTCMVRGDDHCDIVCSFEPLGS